ncbi:hypothetical protein A2U01_0002054, partial [Trifolium medium]|nr:hypothetical protein [Trifolium medium]
MSNYNPALARGIRKSKFANKSGRDKSDGQDGDSNTNPTVCHQPMANTTQTPRDTLSHLNHGIIFNGNAYQINHVPQGVQHHVQLNSQTTDVRMHTDVESIQNNPLNRYKASQTSRSTRTPLSPLNSDGDLNTNPNIYHQPMANTAQTRKETMSHLNH